MKRIENCEMQIAKCKLSGGSLTSSAAFSGRVSLRAEHDAIGVPKFSIFNSQFPICNPPSRRRAFTLVELLVVITIIAMLAGVVLGALAKTREVARADATKATIAKLNELVMRRYESYMTRPVRINVTGLTPAQAATVRLYAIRDLMRMEMPERFQDFNNPPKSLPYVNKALPQPALQKAYQTIIGAKSPGNHAGAKCLYLWVMTSMPEAKNMFSGSEVGDADGDGMKMFLDGWGQPICFLRWAPGFSPNSTIQIADPVAHHDPFDPNNADPSGYQLFPLIYAGVVGKASDGSDDYGLSVGPSGGVTETFLPCTDRATVGAVTAGGPPPITNHFMDQK